MTSLPDQMRFFEAAKNPSYSHPKTIDEYIKRYQIQVKFGYDQSGMCQGLIDLLNELKDYRAKTAQNL